MPSYWRLGPSSVSDRETMTSRIHVSTLVLVTAVIWAGLLLLQGVAITPEFFRPLGTVVGLLVLLLGAFEAYLWRIRWLHPWFVRIPYVGGTWRGVLVSLWSDPATGQPPPPIEAYVSVSQTFSSIRIRFLTNESNSSLLSGSISPTSDGSYEISGVYQNIPRMTVRDRSPIHYGAILLRVIGSPPATLDGEYWTTRGTRGELRLDSRVAARSHDFAEARQLYQRPQGATS